MEGGSDYPELVELNPISTPIEVSAGPSPITVPEIAVPSPRIQVKSRPETPSSSLPSPAPPLRNLSKSASVSGFNTARPTSRQEALETRKTVLSYIRNERDTAQVKWMQLTENLNAEDQKRDLFIENRLKDVTRQLPLQVRKLIGNLKRAVHKTMAIKGGTPFSILRQLFIYWDSNKNGSLSFNDFSSALHSLQIEIPLADRKDIFAYYSHSTNVDARMGYQELLSDIQRDEPSILEFLGSKVNDHDHSELRFEEAADHYSEMPKKVVLFIEAIRHFISNVMRIEGGTMNYHTRKIFQSYDFNYSNGLDPSELLEAAKSRFHLDMTLADAKEIVDYYDRSNKGEMSHALFISDVCKGTPSMLTFVEYTKESIAADKERVKSNPFVKTAFKPRPNKTLERVKESIRKTLDVRLNRTGGSYSSYVNEAFSFWDPKGTFTFTQWQHVQGAILRLGVFITEDEAKSIMACFDQFHRGEIDYRYVMRNILQDETNLVIPSKPGDGKTVTERAPKAVSLFTRKIKTAIDIFVRKSKGSLDPRDILHGTFLRFDSQQTGRVSQADFTTVSRELGVTMREEDIPIIASWFDTNGEATVDYNELTMQLYGEDAFIKSIPFSRSLPKGLEKPGCPVSALEFADTAFTATIKPKKSSIKAMAGPLDSQAISKLMSSGTSLLDSMGNSAEKKLFIETKLVKQARLKIKRNFILQERARIVSKLDSIDLQRKKIVDEHKNRVAERTKAARKAAWVEALGQSQTAASSSAAATA